jgi:ATP-dependent Lon protease
VSPHPIDADHGLPAVLTCLAVRSTVVMPRSVATLEVSRRENLVALERHPEGDTPLVAVPLRDLEGESEPAKLCAIGTLCRVLDRICLPDGSQRVVLQGQRRVTLSSLEMHEGFLRAVAEEPRHGVYDEARLRIGVARAMELALELVARDNRYSAELPRVLALNTSAAGHFVDLAAARLHLPYEDARSLLVEHDVARRLDLLLDLFARELARAELTHDLQHKLQERMRQGFLREQLEVIRGELGQVDPCEAEARQFEARIAAAALSPAAAQRCRRELEHFRRTAPGSAEAGRIRNWLEWTLELPWGPPASNPASGSEDFEQVVTALDLTHTGLEEVKDRVGEFLAVRRLAGAARGTVLCFLGPSGTGKTSMARALGQALGRELVHIHLGSSADEVELRGRHHTQPGALPGCVLQGLLRAGTRNPVVLLDEIDAVRNVGDGATSALLELVDPEQNREFLDHYLGVPFDLSQCVFLVTANDVSTIPDALLDRLEIIPFGSYTESEKLGIAREHLLPKAREAAGLSAHQFQLTQGALIAIVRNYTAEAGVRQLQRTLDSLARKAAVDVVRRGAGLVVKKSALLELLGPANVDQGLHVATARIGVVAGLAWTSAGGAILPIEALIMPGSGQTTLTGSIGDVMRESVQTAQSYVRMCLRELGLPQDALESLDVHLHFPSGATPKDGPSAGIAIATSLVSLLTRSPVRHDVAMTGELSLHGAVLPVGGLREKLLAALRAGIRTVIVPARNSEEVMRLPREVRQRLSIKLVEHVHEAFGVALVRRHEAAAAAPAPSPAPANAGSETAAPAPVAAAPTPPRRRRKSG